MVSHHWTMEMSSYLLEHLNILSKDGKDWSQSGIKEIVGMFEGPLECPREKKKEHLEC